MELNVFLAYFFAEVFFFPMSIGAKTSTISLPDNPDQQLTTFSGITFKMLGPSIKPINPAINEAGK